MGTCSACVRAQPVVRACLVAPAAGRTSLHGRALMQAIHTGTIYRQSKRVHGAIVRITILHIYRWNRVAAPYPDVENAHCIALVTVFARW